jgi:hypothetical protein
VAAHQVVVEAGQAAGAAVRVRIARAARPCVLSCGLVLILLLASSSADPGDPAGSGANDQPESPWAQDLDYFALELPRLHKDLFFKVSPGEFESQVDALRAGTPDLEDYEIVVGLMKIVASVGDSHTMLGGALSGVFRRIPVLTRWFTDGLYVVKTVPEYQQILGKRLTGVSGTPVEDVEKLLATVISHENEAQLKKRFPQFLLIPEVLAALDIVESPDTVRLTIESAGDVTITPIPYETRPEWISVSDTLRCTPPLYLKYPDSYYWFTALGGSTVVYVNYNTCAEMSDRPFASFTEDIFDFVDTHNPDKLVLDLRSNGGGNSAIAQPLIDGLRLRPGLNRDGRLFVIIGRETYSSAILNAISLRTETDAIFVGEATGGKPNHFGEVRFLVLPNSRLTVTYSTKYFRMSPENTPSLYPDIEVGMSFSDLATCRDPAVEAILEYE